ncbi:MAG TPA: 3-oxoacyl-[acyl-carrier-protein] synthase III C-terminal domain-containing protein [Stellaceae bacterium]|nr:3-oxoacyl-[acyl-carrier-protein] synthase III C-terminal domain-containing protein [Stellaceae bacterium]
MLSLATAVPPFTLGQAEVADRARRLFSGKNAADLDRLMPVFLNAGIDRRYSCVPIDWYESPHGWEDRSALYREHAVRLLERAGRDALTRAQLSPDAVDAVVAVSTTGIATPSLDAVLIGRLGLRPDVKRLPLFGLGCAGGVIGLARAADFARATPGSTVLLLVVELCALSFRKDDTTKSNIVATALFGDGAVAALVSSRGAGPALGAAGEHTWRDSLDIMGWDVTEDGLKALFSRDIPALVRRDMRDIASAFLTRHGLGLAEIDRFICHPGGAKVLSALEEVFRLPDGALVEARAVLRDYGNMSAVTVLFVLDRVLRAGASGRMLLTALGPGFTAAFQLLEA